MSEATPDEIISEIDRVRDSAQAAFITRDADEYMRMFSPAVVYKQENGNVISYDRLAADVVRQLRVIPSIEISRVRESFEILNDRVVEVVTQSTSIEAPIMFVITRTIEMTRKGRYVWSRAAGSRWHIVEVEILSDATKSSWRFGFLKPRRS